MQKEKKVLENFRNIQIHLPHITQKSVKVASFKNLDPKPDNVALVDLSIVYRNTWLGNIIIIFVI